MSTQTVGVNGLEPTVIILNFYRTQLLINSLLGLNCEIDHTFRIYSVIFPLLFYFTTNSLQVPFAIPYDSNSILLLCYKQ